MSKRTKVVIADRYSASGRARPDPKTMCRRCEGMGYAPEHRPKDPKADESGYVFARCARCEGTGRRDGNGPPVTRAGIRASVRRVKRALGGGRA